MLKKICYLILFIFITAELYSIEKDKICPYELVSFDAVTIKDTTKLKLFVNLTWVTASEMNTDKFIIERNDPDVITLMGMGFSEIGEVSAKGNSTTYTTYNFSDTLILDLQPAIYRIKGVDKDGIFSYSNEIIIDNFTDVENHLFCKSHSIIQPLFPNPANDNLTFEINLPSPSLVEVQLIDIKGDIVVKKEIGNICPANYMETIDIRELISGEYLLVVKVGSIIETKKIVIVK